MTSSATRARSSSPLKANLFSSLPARTHAPQLVSLCVGRRRTFGDFVRPEPLANAVYGARQVPLDVLESCTDGGKGQAERPEPAPTPSAGRTIEQLR